MPEDYSIGSGFSEGELQFASFWVRRKSQIRRAIFILLISINAGLWGYAGWGLIDAYIISYPVESRITEAIASNQFAAQQLTSNKPVSIKTGKVLVFDGTDNRYDLLVSIQNPNTEWYAEFTYRFNVSGEQTPKQRGFILPKQQTYLGAFGFLPTRGGGRSAALTVDDIEWKRVDPSVVGSDYDEWISRRDGFVIKDIQNQTDLKTGSRTVARTHFIFENPTAYGYWDIGLYIIAQRASAPVGVSYINLSQVKPGESREVNVDWYGSKITDATDTVVIPIVHFLDSSAYLTPERF